MTIYDLERLRLDAKKHVEQLKLVAVISTVALFAVFGVIAYFARRQGVQSFSATLLMLLAIASLAVSLKEVHLNGWQKDLIGTENILKFGAVAISFLIFKYSAALPQALIGLAALALGAWLATRLYALGVKSVQDIFTGRYRQSYKQHYLAPFVRELGYKYVSYGSVPFWRVVQSDLFEFIENLRGNDRVGGAWQGVSFEFSDVSFFHQNLQHELVGAFFVAEFNKRIIAPVFIYPREMQNKQHVGLKPVAMDNVEFAARYKVLSDEPQNAMYVLTPAFMERFLAVGDAMGAQIWASIRERRIHIFVHTGLDNFEPSVYESVLRRDPASEIKSKILNFLSIVKILKLNVRIWI